MSLFTHKRGSPLATEAHEPAKGKERDLTRLFNCSAWPSFLISSLSTPHNSVILHMARGMNCHLGQDGLRYWLSMFKKVNNSARGTVFNIC